MRNYLLTVIAIVAIALGPQAFAALSAAVTASQATVLINQPDNFSIAVANSGASALTLDNLQMTATYNGNPLSRIPLAFSVYRPHSVVLAPLATTTVTASGVFFAPSTGITGAGTGKFYVGAILYTSDGSLTGSASGAAVTVNPLPLPASERQ